jgi:hypothetical protein
LKLLWADLELGGELAGVAGLGDEYIANDDHGSLALCAETISENDSQE